MNLVLLVVGTMLAAIIVHALVWRVRVPARATRTLAWIFGAGFLVDLLAGGLFLPAFGIGEAAYLSALYGAISLMYLLTYTVIEGDSPTLSFALFIWQRGLSGRTRAELEAFVRARPFVQSRLAQLERSGFIVRRGKQLGLAASSLRVLAAGEFYRCLMGRTTRGG